MSSPHMKTRRFYATSSFGNYVLDLEQSQYENGVVISPFEQFFPEGAYELKKRIYGRIRGAGICGTGRDGSAGGYGSAGR